MILPITDEDIYPDQNIVLERMDIIPLAVLCAHGYRGQTNIKVEGTGFELSLRPRWGTSSLCGATDFNNKIVKISNKLKQLKGCKDGRRSR